MTENNYEDLMETGFAAPNQPTSPEKEVFKAIYITGQPRTNDAEVDEEVGKLQVRGLMYNQDKVCMVISHVKSVLQNKPDQDKGPVCFCYKPPNQEWVGTSGKKCPKNRAEREQNSFCKTCRSIMIVAGLACDEDGNPITSLDEETNERKPNFVFIRAHGMKYVPVNDYLSQMAQMDVEPAILPQNTDKDKEIEKQVVNNKRYITEITVGMTSGNYGQVQIFNLQMGEKLPDETVKKVLEMAKKSKEDFANKFDISKKLKNQGGQSSGYGDSKQETFGDAPTETPSSTNNESDQNKGNEASSFENISF